jgi:ribosome-binding protein aMBF1 (putative translation factor)
LIGADACLRIMTPEQSRAARGWFGWSQKELAARANVSVRTVQAFEKGEIIPLRNNIAAMRRAIEAAGVRLVFDRDGTAAGILRTVANPSSG